MRVYRIIKPRYSGKLTGSGKKARWNDEGLEVIYTSRNPMTALMEVSVHLPPFYVFAQYGCDVWEIPDNLPSEQYLPQQLSTGWDQFPYSRETIGLGSRWLRNMATAILRVPSALLDPREENILINPRHPDAEKIRHVTFIFPLQIDDRLQRLFGT